MLSFCALLIDHVCGACSARVIFDHIDVDSPRSPNASSTVLGFAINAVPSGDACATGRDCLLKRSSFSLALAFTFTVLNTSSTFSATSPIATSPSPLATQKRAIITVVNSVSEGVVTLKLTTPFAVEVAVECEMVNGAQSSE